MAARAMLALLLVAACKTPVDCSGAPAVNLLGTWRYTATQSSPTTANLTGALAITSECGSTLGGTLDVTETSAQGSRRRMGTMSGRAVDSATVDFDVFLSAVGRRHLGTIAGDSLRGTWVEPGDAGTASGSFVAVRAP